MAILYPKFKDMLCNVKLVMYNIYNSVINFTQNETPDSPSAGLTEVAFEKSVPMVTYLVCFIVCDFTYKEVRTQNLSVMVNGKFE